MAITKIHAITRSIAQSVDYICDPLKTGNSSQLSFINCTQSTASIEFKYDLNKAKRDSKNLGFHLIQSFLPGEVDEATAHAIAEELVKKVLGNKYTCVIATHNDTDHIHNHIVFCAVDSIEHRRYYDNKKSYMYIRRCNDEICKNYNLSTIMTDDTQQKKSHSYAEWNSKKTFTSWKEKLKNDIQEMIKNSSDYNEFLNKMENLGYEIKNSSPDDGKYISFKAPGQEKWIRGRESTLGKEYTRENIIAAIEGGAITK